MIPLGDDRGWLEKKLTRSTEQVSTLLLKSFSAEVTLGWASHGAFTNISMFFAHIQRSSNVFLPQISLSPIFQSCFHVPFMSFTIQSNHWWQPMNRYIIAYLTIYSPKQSAQIGILPKVLFTGRISFTTVLQGCPRKGCSVAPIHFWVVPAYCAESSVNETWVFSPSVSWS